MKFAPFASAAVLAASTVLAGTAAQARDQVQVAGSSTVLPYATIVAESFGENYPDFKTPIVESGGSSAGLKEFCKGTGPSTIDVANASRKIKDKEIKKCAENGVKEIIEVKIGYDGIVFASDINGADFKFEPIHWFNALAPKIVKDGKLVDNTNTKWSDVDASFPDWEIAAYIPGEKHGTREVFEKKVLAAGCKKAGAMDLYKAEGLDKKAAKKACYKVRKDGKAVDIDGDYTETLARIDSNKTGIGVFGLAFYENNTDKLKVAPVSGIAPNAAVIADGTYPVSRPLYFYVKKAHLGVIPGLKDYVEFFMSDDMTGEGSPTAEYGLVPAPAAERKEINDTIAKGKTL
ncbi:substrate-binding domain-containing protein [Cohaesibacter gelatinilyticus]|uniref:Phosphate ABC transporter substrate-binding protein, PhoT family n=1 Tax=Cohaesibacter gelatinilyticus TaxID=372072 RepID=A0A285PIS6_9HYPH|nr:substrate-binding domain-containing protein [Cohaesibacter gelatinilyticus]SNZ21615.1 phosphate ABC transporter substrate-binding protein, PhoT family [Cohaesibacter gelatinilyticus]